MAEYFYPVQQEKSWWQSHWRWFVGVMCVVVVSLGIGLYRVGVAAIGNPQSDRVPMVLSANFAAQVPQVGGDIVVPIPAYLPPPIPELVGEPIDMSSFSAVAALVKDVESGKVLFASNEYTARPLASITKLMSALVILERNPDWSSSTQVVADDLIDTHMYAGDTYTFTQLWDAALIGSSNKAIMTLSDAVGWNRDAFVARMNEKAHEMGMGETVFVEPTGLDEGNVSSPSDIALLLQEALQHERIVNAVLTDKLSLFSKERQKSHSMWNTNWLHLGWIPSKLEVVGGKTGYIIASGYNFTTRVAHEDGRELDVVVLGTDSHEARFAEARDLAEWTFTHFSWPEEKESY